MNSLFLSALLLWQPGIDDPNHFNNYLMLGYVVMGLITLGYVVTLFVRQRNLQQDVQLMAQLLQEDEQK